MSSSKKQKQAQHDIIILLSFDRNRISMVIDGVLFFELCDLWCRFVEGLMLSYGIKCSTRDFLAVDYINGTSFFLLFYSLFLR